MMSNATESEWLLERLCESLVRLEKRKEVASLNDRLMATQDGDDTHEEVKNESHHADSSSRGAG